MTDKRPEVFELVESIGDLVVRRDVEGRVVYVNAAFRRAFGGAVRDWIGETFPLQTADIRVAAGGRRRLDVEMETVAGTAFFEWEETPLPDGGVALVGRDVSARRAGEAALIYARDAAEAEVRGRETLFASITHELRTPAAGAVGMATLLRGTALSPEQRAYVDAIADSGAHLMALVDDVLDAAKLEAGAFELVREPFDLEPVLRNVIELVSPRARQKGLETAIYVDPGVPLSVVGDAGRLRQILLNLLGNAVKFTSAGGVALAVEREAGEPGEARLAFHVRDTGPGVPAADRARIFGAFSRARSGATRTAEGAGLGLSIVQRLTDAMGGQVGLESPPEGGAWFWVRLGFSVASESDRGSAPLNGVSAVVAGPAAPVRAAIARQLSSSGARVREVQSVDELAATLMAEPMAALVDAAWAEAAAEAVTRARVALVLAAPDQKGRLDALQALGYRGWIVKPPRPGSLVDYVRQAWDGRLVAGAGTAEAKTVEPGPSRAAGTDGLRVLLAEDNPVNRLMAGAVLRRCGAQFDEAVDGRAAAEAAAARAYDVILMDMRMPTLDGLEAARLIRAGGGPNAQTPILALTANAEDADRRACLAAGMNDFLTKPIDESALSDALSRWTRAAAPAKLQGP